MSDVPEGLDPNFNRVLTRMRVQSNLTSLALQSVGRRRWDLFNFDMPGNDVEYDSGVSLQANGIGIRSGKNLFERDEATKTYIEAHTKEDKDGKPQDFTGVAKAAKVQVDFLAGLGRDFAARHIPRVRLFGHEALRKESHGSTDGPMADTLMWIAALRARPELIDVG